MDGQTQRATIETRLRAALRLALLDPNDNWAEPVTALAASLVNRAYRDLFDERIPKADRDRIVARVAKLLEDSDRDAQSDSAQASLLASGAAHFITESLLSTGTGSGWVKDWVTAGDDDVRPSHVAAALDGPVPADKPFTVGGHDMFGPGDVSAPIEEWANCRCHSNYRRVDDALVASMGGRTDEGFLTLSRELFDEALRAGIVTESGVRGDDGVVLYSLKDGTSVVAAEGEIMAEPVAEPLDLNGEYPWEEVPLYGVIAPENVPTGDKRKFLVDSLKWVEPPLSLSWQETDMPGHDGAVVTGRIDDIWKDAGLWKWQGAASMNVSTDKMLALIAERALRGVSVDLDDTEVEFQTADGELVKEGDTVDTEPLMAVSKGRIRKATVVAVPAFIEAFVAIGTWADHDQPNDKAGEAPEVTEASIKATAASILAFGITSKPGTEDGPGWLTHPVDTDRLRDYWTHGEGAAKIGWGTPGDFNRCRVLLSPYVKEMYLSGYCANRHKDALGIWPGEHRGGALAASAAQAQLDHPDDIAPAWTVIPRLEEEEAAALVAGGNATLLRPPGWWFERPPEFAGIDRAQPVVVTEEGRFYGYAAEWGVCHLGYGNECVYAPRSPSNYAWFRLGDKITTDGNVPIGVVTIGTGHAPLSMDAFHAAAHYDNTGTVAAQIASGDDEFGIWVAGCVAPSATPEQIDDLRASKLSGDWREIGRTRELDMVRVLAVNTPGFGIPRMALAASASGEEYRSALVAAGTVESSDERIARLVAEGVELTLAQRERAESMKALRDTVYAHRRTQIAALTAARKD